MKKAITGVSVIAVLMAILMFMGCSSSSSVAEEESDVSFYGQVIDGPIKNMLVFVDSDEDGELGDGELFAYSNKNGNFHIKGKKGKCKKGDILIAVGGPDAIDISTNLAFTGILKSKIVDEPAADPTTIKITVMSPATTVAVEMGEGWNAEVQQSLGISVDIDIYTYNPFAIINDANATPAQKQVAVSIQQFNVKVVSMVDTLTAMYMGSIDEDSKSYKDLTASAKSTKKKKAKKDISKLIITEISNKAKTKGFTIANFGNVDIINVIIANVGNSVSTKKIITINPTKMADVQVNVVNQIVTINNYVDTISTSGATTNDMMISIAKVGIIIVQKSTIIQNITSSGSMEDIASLIIIDINNEINNIDTTKININISISPGDDNYDDDDSNSGGTGGSGGSTV